MIWPDKWIKVWAREHVTPFDEGCVNPASLDLKLGDQFVALNDHDREFVADEITIMPGQAYLGTTVEFIEMPINASGVVYLKSSMARLGLDHSLAGYVDPNFRGQLTVEIHAHREITLRKDQRFIQLALYSLMDIPDRPYDGRYQNQRGPTKAREKGGF